MLIQWARPRLSSIQRACQRCLPVPVLALFGADSPLGIQQWLNRRVTCPNKCSRTQSRSQSLLAVCPTSTRLSAKGPSQKGTGTPTTSTPLARRAARGEAGTAGPVPHRVCRGASLPNVRHWGWRRAPAPSNPRPLDEVTRPVAHQDTPPLEQVRSGIGRLHPVPDHVRQG